MFFVLALFSFSLQQVSKIERAKYGQNSGKVAAKCTSVTQR